MTISFLPKIRNKIIEFLKQGITPQKLATAFSLGICIGVIPLLGSTSLLCMLIAFILRLNMATIQSVNYLTYPLQLLLYIPFLKAGAYLAHEDFNYSLTELISMLSENTWETVQRFFIINLYALLLWFPLAVLGYFLSYFILFKTFTRFSKIVKT